MAADGEGRSEVSDAKQQRMTTLEKRLSATTMATALQALVGLAILLSAYLDWGRIDASMATVARERGAALFQLVELAREWNARHGGVYAPVTEVTQPNPYLEHKRRDVSTTGGLALTMINPAFMTRQMAEIAAQVEGTQLHITSNKPIRPENKPDAWESAALDRFEEGLPETIELIRGDVPVHRYMAPLRVKKACLTCHEKQGYKLGQIRGGISVTMPAAKLLEIRDNQRLQTSLVHGVTLLAMITLIQLLTSRSRRHMSDLQRLASEQEQVIAERTRLLSDANAGLKIELAEREVATAVFENTGGAIVVTDENAVITRINPAFSRITGYSEDEVVGRNMSILKSGHHPPEFFMGMWRDLQQGNRWRGEIWNRRKNGEVFVALLSITHLVQGVSAGGYVSTFTDISEVKQEQDSLRHQAYHDPLTDLPNRMLFADRLNLAASQSRRSGHLFALCLIDLDHFKGVNDTHGHSAGDELLVEVARRLNACVRAVDTVARLGGDEFAAILPEIASHDNLHEIAARIVDEMARPFSLVVGSASISCSVGIALFPEHGDDLDVLKDRADAALYTVKEAGRNGYLCAPSA